MSTEDRRARRQRWAAVAVGTASLLTVASGAVAAWSVSGGDAVEATIASVEPLTVDVTAPLNLYPGAVRTVDVVVTNTNAFPIVVDSVTWTSVTPSDNSCDTSNITVNGRSAIGQTIAAGVTATVAVPSGITLKTTAVNACQGKRFTMTALVQGSSATS